MRGFLFILAWTFTTAAACFDAIFAWHYRASFQGWEMNPLMRGLAEVGGLPTVFAFKMAGLVLATGLACYCYQRHTRLARSLTVVVVGIHSLLMVHYATGCV
ncbi:MAG TPA: DUF5658 family protein [Gemmataceae bacterium]|nr:DUF5658 family protein [Gemmataceae bacterium]